MLWLDDDWIKFVQIFKSTVMRNFKHLKPVIESYNDNDLIISLG